MSSQKTTGPQQIRVLKNLNQQAAAWMLGCTARALRDWPDAPRNENGTYPARELVEWARDRVPRPDLSDDDYDRLLVIQDVLYNGEPSDGERLSIIDALRALRRKYGENAWLVFVDMLVREWADIDEQFRAEAFSVPTETDIRRKVDSEMSGWECRLARDQLRIATVCDYCGKLRRGRHWIKADPPEGYAVQGGGCPTCHVTSSEQDARKRASLGCTR